MAANSTSFKKNDPRINRLGRPKSFDALRSLAQQVANEVAKSGGQEAIIDGHKVTVAEAIVRSWALSKNPQLQKAFVEIAYGKVPDPIELTSASNVHTQAQHDALIVAIRAAQ
jgi:hypothetical protein